jgi:hypothetical protein
MIRRKIHPTRKSARFGLSGPLWHSSGGLRETQTAWLATQWDSNQSPRKFPANREFGRENCSFRVSEAAHKAGNPCVAVTIRAFPYEMKQGKVLEEQGISAQGEGIARGASTYP